MRVLSPLCSILLYEVTKLQCGVCGVEVGVVWGWEYVLCRGQGWCEGGFGIVDTGSGKQCWV